jgi:hypothetical protein
MSATEVIIPRSLIYNWVSSVVLKLSLIYNWVSSVVLKSAESMCEGLIYINIKPAYYTPTPRRGRKPTKSANRK